MKEFKFKDVEMKLFEGVISELETLKQKKEISEQTLRSLTNIVSSLEGIRESVYWKFLNSLKKI